MRPRLRPLARLLERLAYRICPEPRQTIEIVVGGQHPRTVTIVVGGQHPRTVTYVDCRELQR